MTSVIRCIAGTVCISKYFFRFFKILIFQVIIEIKGQKMVQNPKKKKKLSLALHISGTINALRYTYF